jgi:hypothetical protein
MCRKILVSIFTRPFLGGESGASLASVVLLSGLMLTGVAGTLRFMDQRKTYLEIVRMQTRTDLFEAKLQNAARSMRAMEMSARAAGAGSALYQCVINQQCQSSSTFRRYRLMNAPRTALSGLKTLSGESCEGDCPMRVDTRYAIDCGAGVSNCNTPAEIRTRYRIAKNSSNFFGDRYFQERQGMASLASFTCDDEEYISSIASDGTLFCEKAIASRYSASCPKGSAAFGLNEKGLLKCVPIIDYCATPLGFSYVMDTSGSMRSSGKLVAAQNSAIDLVGGLKKGDRGAVTTFDSKASLKSGLTDNLGNIKGAIGNTRASGLTNMSAGLKVGGDSVMGMKNGEKVLVFLSDGRHNTGDVHPADQAKILKDNGIRIFTVGFGDDRDDNMLMRVASSPDDYFSAKNPGELKKAFGTLGKIMCR